MGWLPIVKLPGLENAIKGATALRNMLGPGWKVSLGISERTGLILSVQADHGRDVVSLDEDDAAQVQALFKEHVEAARGSDGRISGGAEAGEALYRDLGEFLRDTLAAKINDEKAVPKAPLTERYAEWKAARYGNKPILVASEEMLSDVRSAPVDVTKGG